MSAASIGIVDYGMGNRRSVEKAVEHVGARPLLSSDPDLLRSCDGLIVPGVGAFPQAMRNLRERGLDQAIHDHVTAGRPLLGICLGMQLLLDSSTELGGESGLGLVPGVVSPLDAGDRKLPHIGWNRVRWCRSSALTDRRPEASAFYHVHSLVARPDNAEDVLGESEYGERFATAVDLVERTGAPVYGLQFHPEKSSADGLALLANFSALAARVVA